MKEPELIANTVIDPHKWEEALDLLTEVTQLADREHSCDTELFCEECDILDRAERFLEENE